MKKSLIALAVLAAAGTASAQSSVTLFGIVDATLQVGRGSLTDKTQLASSGYNASRVGFRGTEDLGGGLSASFWLEASLSNDNGTGGATNTNNQASGGALAGMAGGQGLVFSRRSTIGLAGAWGEVRLGRDVTPQYWNLGMYDPFGNVGVGATQMLTSIITGVTSLRASNSIGYYLPGKLGGFYGQGMYYLGENNEAGLATDDDGRGMGVRVGYAKGPFDVAVATSRTEYAAGDVRQSNIGGSWDLGVVRAMAILSRDKNGTVDAKGWMIGGLVPVGAGTIRASYSVYETDAAGEPESRKLALGYAHNLSKRTILYTNLARVKNSGGARAALGGSTTAANASSTGLDIGVRHSF